LTNTCYALRMGRPLGSKNKRTGRDKFPTCYAVDEATGCWNWIRPLANTGYGEFRNDGHKLAHRWVYATFVRPIPEGMYVLHRCDNRACVNPDHLFIGTNHDNILDMVAKGRHWLQGPDRRWELQTPSIIAKRRKALRDNWVLRKDKMI
jgi:hypothetical protein